MDQAYFRIRQRSWDFSPFAALILPQGEVMFPPLPARLPLNEHPPRCFLFEGSAAVYVLFSQQVRVDRSWAFISASGIRPAASRGR
jgi:hypothetical protein